MDEIGATLSGSLSTRTEQSVTSGIQFAHRRRLSISGEGTPGVPTQQCGHRANSGEAIVRRFTARPRRGGTSNHNCTIINR